jgi:hypothetical protein
MTTPTYYWFFTFGFGHTTAEGYSLARCYIRVPIEDYNKAREYIMSIRGRKWAAQYKIVDLARQIETHRLIEVLAEDVILPKAQQMAQNPEEA